jgi:lysophospholipase L1-like esterase
LLVLVVTLLVCVALIDAVAYFALGVRGSRHGSDDFVQFSPLLGHFHKPLAQGRYYPRRGRDGHDVQISSRGFCDEERDIEKTRPRIVLIGDSTTEAWEVDPHERPHRVLEEALEGQFEVLNLGVRAYGTDQSLLLLKHLGMAFQPDIVVYTFCINDIRDNAKRAGKPYFEVDEADTARLVTRGYPVSCEETEGRRTADPVWKYSLVYRTFGLAVSKFGSLSSGGGTGLPLEEHFELTPYKVAYDEREAARWRVTRRLVAEMRAVASAGGAESLVVENLHLPEIDTDAASKLTAPYGGEGGFDFDKVTRLFEGFADDTGGAFVSLARVARRDERAAADLMPPGDTIHLSLEGVRLWVSGVAGQLESRGWLKM